MSPSVVIEEKTWYTHECSSYGKLIRAEAKHCLKAAFQNHYCLDNGEDIDILLGIKNIENITVDHFHHAVDVARSSALSRPSMKTQKVVEDLDRTPWAWAVIIVDTIVVWDGASLVLKSKPSNVWEMGPMYKLTSLKKT